MIGSERNGYLRLGKQCRIKVQVFFRVDASLQMGIGHVMRCLTLANVLKIKGHETHFICREHPGNLISRLEKDGHQVHKLPMGNLDTNIDDYKSDEQNYPSHLNWLGEKWNVDAELTSNILKNYKADWLVVDHYALEKKWENVVNEDCNKMMIIDDLADREHNCDLLMDQAIGRKSEDYINLVPKKCELLVGTKYILLRNEFLNLRSIALKHRRNISKISRILVTLGGTDPDNVTGLVLDGLLKSDLGQEKKVDIILGSNSPHKDAIRNKVSNMPMNITLSIDVSDIANRMLKADLAIGAGGTTSWERCCLGLPTLIVITADNQELVVKSLKDYGAVINMGHHRKLTPDMISHQINKILYNPIGLKDLSAKALKIVNGNGARRISKILERNG